MLFRSVYEKIVEMDPSNGEHIKRLVGLYGKTGNIEKAKELMSNLTKYQNLT